MEDRSVAVLMGASSLPRRDKAAAA